MGAWEVKRGGRDEPLPTNPHIQLAELRAQLEYAQRTETKHKDWRVLINVGAVISAVAVFLTFFLTLKSIASDAGVKGEAAAAAVDKKLDAHITEEKADIREIRQDLKELYRVMPKRARSKRLEEPLDAGGED